MSAFSREMIDRARELRRQHERHVDLLWDEEVVERLMIEFNIDQEQAEVLAFDA